jgi:hypothetical protein
MKTYLNAPLLTCLIQADVVCRDCGSKYGKYSVGCSSTWEGTCEVCGERKGVTEVRDWGYLSKGIQELKGTVKEQSAKVADYMAWRDAPIMTDAELEGALSASYEQGDLTLKLTEDEVGFLNECLDTIQEYHCSLQFDASETNDVALFESIERKITDLYEDNCVEYELSPALKKFHELYGTYGIENDVERAKWGVFNDAFHAGFDYSKEGVQ